MCCHNFFYYFKSLYYNLKGLKQLRYMFRYISFRVRMLKMSGLVDYHRFPVFSLLGIKAPTLWVSISSRVQFNCYIGVKILFFPEIRLKIPRPSTTHDCFRIVSEQSRIQNRVLYSNVKFRNRTRNPAPGQSQDRNTNRNYRKRKSILSDFYAMDFFFDYKFILI